MQDKRIVVTRALHQTEMFSALLRRTGAVPVLYPCIAMVPPPQTAALDAALHAASAGTFDWLILTSTNTVLALAQRLTSLGLAPARLGNMAIAAVGPTTAVTARRLLGLEVQTIPETYAAAALAQALQPVARSRILLPQADQARQLLSQELAASGAEVTTVTAYCTVLGSGGEDVPALLASHRVDAITFTSPSTVENCLRRLAAEGADPSGLTGVCLACLGPTTLQAAREHGLVVAVTPARATLSGLVTALAAHFSNTAAASGEVQRPG
jgi:uroporphyrinogen-III synthase